jgi:hypothetical protein
MIVDFPSSAEAVWPRKMVAAMFFCSLTGAALSPQAAEAVDPGLSASITVTVSPDPDGVETALVGRHVLRVRDALRSKSGEPQMTVGCVPCFSVYLSFALTKGRLYAMNGQTDNRRARYSAQVEGKTVAVEAMSALRGRDWLDAYREVDRVPGCARDVARGKDIDAVARRGSCIAE